MKKIALFFALFAGLFTTAMAQEETTTTPDSLFVVDANGSVIGKHELAEGAYITFTHPTEWRAILSDVKTYFYNGSSYNFTDYTYKHTIYQDRNKNYFYIDNFLNSGSGFTFKIMNSDGTYDETIPDYTKVDGILMPVENEGVEYGTDYGTCRWGNYYTSEGYSWTDTVNNVENLQFGMYMGDGYSTFKGTASWIGLTGFVYVGSKSTYTTLYIDWR